MNRIIDKIFIFILSIFAMCIIMHGNYFLVCFYVAIVISALNYYLLNRDRTEWGLKAMKPLDAKEWAAFIIEIICMILPIFIPETIVLLPVIGYDIARSRNYVGAGIGIISLINVWKSAESMSNYVILYILAVTGLAVFISVKSESLYVARREHRRLRDDSQEKSEKLRDQNREILLARDSEVHNAQLSERNRIAREIHDNVGHMLSRALLQMGALLAIHKEEPIHSELESVRETLDTAMNNIRSSVHDLHDESIDMVSSLTELAKPLEENYHLTLDIDISDDMQRPVKYAIIGIVKECISNIIKHSNNTNVDIRLLEHPSMYQLVVHDYGEPAKSEVEDRKTKVSVGSVDMQEKDSAGVGMGLENIRTRAQSVGGTCNITDDNGFRVFVTIPR